jgi:hypothetical protein
MPSAWLQSQKEMKIISPKSAKVVFELSIINLPSSPPKKEPDGLSYVRFWDREGIEF